MGLDSGRRDEVPKPIGAVVGCAASTVAPGKRPTGRHSAEVLSRLASCHPAQSDRDRKRCLDHWRDNARRCFGGVRRDSRRGDRWLRIRPHAIRKESHGHSESRSLSHQSSRALRDTAEDVEGVPCSECMRHRPRRDRRVPRAQVAVLADASLPWILRRWVGLAVSGGTTR